jgi:DNA-binding response OmpR family regulator
MWRGGSTRAWDSTARPSVALLCPEPRLRRILGLSLEAAGLAIIDRPWPSSPLATPPSVVVADLDGLGWDLMTTLQHLANARLDDATPALLVSVYPYEADGLGSGRPLDVLQPPFSSQELTRRVHALLRRAAAEPPRPI